jgi:hypothetical protein
VTRKPDNRRAHSPLHEGERAAPIDRIGKPEGSKNL